MCKTGGPRCEYADELNKLRRRVKRTKKYKETYWLDQEKLLKSEEDKWKKKHPELVKEHAKKKEKWQTKARPLSRGIMATLRPHFSSPTFLNQEEANAHAASMAAEREAWEEQVDRNINNAIGYYTMAGYKDINGFLRAGEKGLPKDPWAPDKDNSRLLELTKERIKEMDSLFMLAQEPEAPRQLYRHHIVPAGWKPREYAEKYFPIGEKISDPAFLSTTEDPAYVAGHLEYRKPSQYVVYQILTKKGVSLQDTEVERAGSVQSFEKERLLPRGTAFRIVGHKREKFSVPDDRKQMSKHFSTMAYSLWGEFYKIKDRHVTVVMLMDEDLIEEYSKKTNS